MKTRTLKAFAALLLLLAVIWLPAPSALSEEKLTGSGSLPTYYIPPLEFSAPQYSYTEIDFSKPSTDSSSIRTAPSKAPCC